MKKIINIVFPNQLYEDSAFINNGHPIYLIEEFLFFKQYNFHKQKIAFHRASMKSYESYLQSKNKKVIYIESDNNLADIRQFILHACNKNVSKINFYDVVDNWLNKRINSFKDRLELNMIESQSFINSNQDLEHFFKKNKKKFSHAVFYKQQRIKHNILMSENNEPLGGKFSFDLENRKKYPKAKEVPKIYSIQKDAFWNEAKKYVQNKFSNNFGQISENPIYPISTKQSKEWFKSFLSNRFKEFGDYEDAILSKEVFLNHSVISPLLNSGLLKPQDIIVEINSYADKNNIPLNSHEGFIRQIIGWREFIRGMYCVKGSESRTLNFWQFKRKLPQSFYDGSTGIKPVDDSIKKISKYGYCHHIERLMVLGNFMLLCEFDPNEVYVWFMEVFVDSYDWVMVPNVYGMSQFADGGFFATKPYIGGSNYIKKMSDYKDGDWSKVWDGLFWNFINNQSKFFKSNPRLSMMYHSLNRMSNDKKNEHIKNANQFLKSLNT